MMKKIFLWFYCLPISRIVILMILATVVWLLLRQKLGKKRFWRPAVFALLLSWLLVIFFGTLVQRVSTEEPAAPILMPFFSYLAVLQDGERELLRECFLNVLLFYPAGLLAWEALPERWGAVWKTALIALLAALISAGIEACQYFFGLGLAETDDVIHNALGALLGSLVSTIRFRRN